MIVLYNLLIFIFGAGVRIAALFHPKASAFVTGRKDVFRPGYSTKKRGWGLGLSLSKRIIEGYHGGKIFVKSSMPGEGTTFKIILKSC